MSNKIHHAIVEEQKSNRRIRKAITVHANKYYTSAMKKWRRAKNKRCHLFMIFPKYREVWKAAKRLTIS